jgi:hypothetical protein
MREIRPSGSEGGAGSIPCPYPYQQDTILRYAFGQPGAAERRPQRKVAQTFSLLYRRFSNLPTMKSDIDDRFTAPLRNRQMLGAAG